MGDTHATQDRAAEWDSRRMRYVTEQGFRLYGCAKRGCDAVNPDYEAFGVGDRSYCLHHIPFLTRMKMRRRLYD